VIQANGLRMGIPQIVMAAITSNLQWTGAMRVLFRQGSQAGRTMGLNRDSVVMTDNLSTILEREIESVIGHCPAMQFVDAALRITLDL
jgi:mRNA interferase MazF